MALVLPAHAQGIWPTNPSNGMPTQGTVGPLNYPPPVYPRERFDGAITNAPAVYPAYPQPYVVPCCYYPRYIAPRYYRHYR
jgi:hypothetical protein